MIENLPDEFKEEDADENIVALEEEEENN